MAVTLPSNPDTDAAQYLADEQVPVTGWHLSMPAWGRLSNMFSSHNVAGEAEDQRTTRHAEVLKALGATKVATVAGGNAASVSFAELRAVGRRGQPRSGADRGLAVGDTFVRGLQEAGASCPTRDAFVTNLRLVEDDDAGESVETRGGGIVRRP